MRQLDRLQTRLNIIFILLAIVPLLIVSVLISQRSTIAIRRDAQIYLLERSKHIASEIQAFIEGRTNTLLYMAQVNGLSNDEQSELINGMLAFDTSYQEIAVLNTAGMEIERVSRNDVVQPADYHDRSDSPEFTTIVNGDEDVYYSTVRFDTELREPLMTISVPVIDRRTGVLYKILVADFRFRAVWQLLNTQDYQMGETAYVVDETGTVVAHRNPSAAIRDTLRETGFTMPDSNTGISTNTSGEDVLFAIQPLQIGTDEFVVVAEQTTTQALALARDVQMITVMAIIATLVILAGLIVLVVRYFVQPIEHLSQVSKQIAKGDLAQRAHVQGRGEIPALARSFNAMADQLSSLIGDLEQRLEELRQSEEKYRLLVDNSYQGIMIEQVNPLRIAFASQSIENILGYTPEEMLAMDSDQLRKNTHPDDWEPFVQHFLDSLEGKEVDPNFRVRVYHAAGSLRHLNVHRDAITYKGEPATQVTFVDVTGRIEAERLKAQFQKEQLNNELVQRVIAMLSHDLRTSLAVIATSRDMLSHYSDRMSEEQRQEKLDRIGHQIQFALGILEDTVHTARGNLNEQQFNPTEINVATLCQVSIDELRFTQDQDYALYFINVGNVETVQIDEVLVSRILLNLLSNALKYSPDGGEIRLELDHNNEWIILRVIDQGMGIHADDLPHIFEPFYRSEAAHPMQGTGLGLNIVKDCVDRHQGRVYVESVVGQGSTFTVELPIKTPVAN